MFRFFRQLRHDQLTPNPPGRPKQAGRFSRYLAYAVGEILLVVIGILLALQIDAWNEQRIQRKKERLYLSEIRMNLLDDLDNVQYSISFNSKKDSLIEACLNTMLKAETDGEAMQTISRNMPVLTEFSVFTQNRVAFDNMLSAENIDLISRDSVRTLLSTYYSERNLLQGTQERVKELTRKFVDNATPLMMNKENIRHFFGVESEFVSGNDQDFRTNQVLFGDLFGMQRNIESHSLYLLGYQKSIEKIIGQIDGFLAEEE